MAALSDEKMRLVVATVALHVTGLWSRFAGVLTYLFEIFMIVRLRLTVIISYNKRNITVKGGTYV